jgi:hypothetical protein
MPNYEYMYITYSDAQRLIPFYEKVAKEHPWKEVRESAKRLLRELRMVRDIDYSPASGHQLILNRVDHQFLMDTMDAMGL